MEERGSEVTRWLLHFRQGKLVTWTKAAMDKSLLMVSSVGFVDIRVCWTTSA